MKRVLLSAAGMVLLVAVAAPLVPRPPSAPARAVSLAHTLPVRIPGWESKELTLGATEVVQGAVEKTLRFDEVFYRAYRSGRGEVTVYAAHWEPGKMPTQLVAAHTPDRCWSSAGWTCDERRSGEALGWADQALRPGEWRVFREPSGTRIEVYFWHLVGDDLYDYGDRFNRIPSAWRWWRDAARQVFRAPPEQYFIRVTSNRPFAELKGDPGWEELLRALAKLGLAEREAGSGEWRKPDDRRRTNHWTTEDGWRTTDNG